MAVGADLNGFDGETTVFGRAERQVDMVTLTAAICSVVVVLKVIVASIHEFPRIKHEFQFL